MYMLLLTSYYVQSVVNKLLCTGCPTKHDSMQDDLNIVLIFAAFICQPNFRSKYLEIIITKSPAISKMWSAFFVLSILPEI